MDFCNQSSGSEASSAAALFQDRLLLPVLDSATLPISAPNLEHNFTPAASALIEWLLSASKIPTLQRRRAAKPCHAGAEAAFLARVPALLVERSRAALAKWKAEH